MQYISIAVLILLICVINKQSIIENIGSLLWPLHCSLLCLHLGQTLQEICEMTYSSNTNGSKAFRVYGVLRGRFTSNVFFFFSKEMKKKRTQQKAELSEWGWQVATTTNNIVFESGENRVYRKCDLILWNACTVGLGPAASSLSHDLLIMHTYTDLYFFFIKQLCTSQSYPFVCRCMAGKLSNVQSWWSCSSYKILSFNQCEWENYKWWW